MRTLRLAALAAALITVALIAAAPAGASSIVYEKDGNVWLTSPDGARQYQVTFDGRWATPSQADDGTILARDRTSLVRMDRSGRILGQVTALGGATTINPAPSDADQFYGPWEPKLSPDGKRIAYTFGQYENYYSPACNCIQWGLMHYTTTTAVDHLDSGPQNATREDESPSWIDSRRMLVWDPWFTYQASTWVDGGDWHNRQWWFRYQDAMLRDGELSPDGSKVVAVAATGGLASPYNTLLFFATNGPAWSGEPPYNEDIQNGPEAPEPTVRCQNVRDSDAADPTWSTDSKSIAYQDKDGIWIQQVPALTDACDGLSEKLLVPGGHNPDWGPADVNMADKPKPGNGPGASPSPAAAKIGALRVSPTRFRVARARSAKRGGATVTFRLTGSAPVVLRVQRVAGRRVLAVRGNVIVGGRAGANTVRFTGRIGGRALAAGRYRLVATTGKSSVRAAFTVAR